MSYDRTSLVDVAYQIPEDLETSETMKPSATIAWCLEAIYSTFPGNQGIPVRRGNQRAIGSANVISIDVISPKDGANTLPT